MNEIIVKIIGRLDLEYGNLIDQQKVRSIIEEVLYGYNITSKETLPATLDDMQEKVMLYIAVKKIEGASVNTIKAYKKTLRQFSNHIRKNVKSITTMDIRIYLAFFAEKELKNTSIATYTSILRAFFAWLESEDYISKNPMDRIKTIKIEKRLKEALTKTDIELLRTGAKTYREKAIFEVFYSTGARLSEIEQMKLQDIDWQKGQIKVIGKGDKERIVFMSPSCQVHLKKYLMSRTDDCDAVFITKKKPYKYLGKDTIRREVKRIAKNAGLNKNVSPHLFRRSASTHWLNSNMDMTVVKEILGHSTISTTEIYCQVSDSEVEHQFRKYA